MGSASAGSIAGSSTATGAARVGGSAGGLRPVFPQHAQGITFTATEMLGQLVGAEGLAARLEEQVEFADIVKIHGIASLRDVRACWRRGLARQTSLTSKEPRREP